MVEQQVINIGTTTYAVTQMDAIRALKVQAKLIKILGTSIIDFIMGGINFGNLKEDPKSVTTIANAIEKMMNNFDDEIVVAFVLSLFEKGVFIRKDVNGQSVDVKVDFAIDFGGKIMEMWQVVKFILEVNFNLGKSTESSSNTTQASG